MSFSKHQGVHGTKNYPKYLTPKPDFIIEPAFLNTFFFWELNMCNFKQFFKIHFPSEMKEKFRELVSRSWLVASTAWFCKGWAWCPCWAEFCENLGLPVLNSLGNWGDLMNSLEGLPLLHYCVFVFYLFPLDQWSFLDKAQENSLLKTILNGRGGVNVWVGLFTAAFLHFPSIFGKKKNF